MDPFGIEVQTPDEFVLNQQMLEKLTALAAPLSECASAGPGRSTMRSRWWPCS